MLVMIWKGARHFRRMDFTRQTVNFDTGRAQAIMVAKVELLPDGNTAQRKAARLKGASG
jgi:hypothetical protein